MVRLGAVEPRRRRWSVDPRMVWTSVIHHLVLNDLDAGARRSLDQLTQLSARAEGLLGCVEVVRVVAVKPGARFVFLQLDVVQAIVVVVLRRQPDRRDAEVF